LRSIDALRTSGRVVFFAQPSVVKANSFPHCIQFVAAQASDISSLGGPKEGEEVCVRWKLRKAISIISNPVTRILEDHCALLHSVVRVLSDHIVPANVTNHKVEEHGAFDPKIDGIEEVIEVLPGSWVADEASNLGKLLSQERRHPLNLLIEIRANDRSRRRIEELALNSSSVSSREKSRGICRNVVELCRQSQLEIRSCMGSKWPKGRHGVWRGCMSIERHDCDSDRRGTM
jgi:hypothetical protein